MQKASQEIFRGSGAEPGKMREKEPSGGSAKTPTLQTGMRSGPQKSLQ